MALVARSLALEWPALGLGSGQMAVVDAPNCLPAVKINIWYAAYEGS